MIRPYDPGTLKDIEKAIVASDLGFNPQNDGRLIRINIPPLSTEVRRKMVDPRQGTGRGSQGRHPQRPPRRQQGGRQAEKDKELSEDERDNTKEQIQDLTKQYEEKVNDMAKAKEAEVMEED